MPLVSGLLAPTDVLAELGKGLPASNPFATISLFSELKGSHSGGTSLLIILDDKPRAPNRKYS